MLYRISKAAAHPNYVVTVTWSDGITADVDLSSVIALGNVFEPLKDPSYFVGEMRVAADRLGLEWPGGVDLSADGLRFRAFPKRGGRGVRCTQGKAAKATPKAAANCTVTDRLRLSRRSSFKARFGL
jgi:hypothetical protein